MKHSENIRTFLTISQVETMTRVMYTCMILHNMILEDKGSTICDYDENQVIAEIQSLIYDSPEFTQRMGYFTILLSIVIFTTI